MPGFQHRARQRGVPLLAAAEAKLVATLAHDGQHARRRGLDAVRTTGLRTPPHPTVPLMKNESASNTLQQKFYDSRETSIAGHYFMEYGHEDGN